MLRKVEQLLKQCKGKNTIKKWEHLLIKLTSMAMYDFDLMMRGNTIPYRVTVNNGLTKQAWLDVPDEGFDISVESEDPDKIGRLIFDEVIKRKRLVDTTFTFIDYESKMIQVRVKGDNYHRPIFLAKCRGRWNGALEDAQRDIDHNSKKEDWRKSL